MQSFLFITGPTASGKSSLSISLAKRFHGEILNADSVQLYNGFNIGAAKPTEQEKENIAHHLFDIGDPLNEITAGNFLYYAQPLVREIRTRNALPIFVGSAGLYSSVLLSGISELPSKDEALRINLEARSSEELLSMLTEINPTRAAMIHLNDRQRLIRAIEIGNSLAEKMPGIDGFAIILCIVWPRNLLYERINERAHEMVEKGIIQETITLEERYGVDHNLFKSIGYSQAIAHINGNVNKETLASEIAQATRNYAKRQMTYWRNQPERQGWKTLPSQPSRAFSHNKIHDFITLELSRNQLYLKLEDRLKHSMDAHEVWFLDGPKIFC